MAAGEYNIIIDKGATFAKTLTLRSANNDPMDLTDVAEVRASLRRSSNNDESWNFDFAIPTPTSGQIEWSMSANTTDLLPGGNCLYDLELEWDNGTIDRLLMGTATVRFNITR